MTIGISKLRGVTGFAQSALLIVMVYFVPGSIAQEQSTVQARTLLSAAPTSVTGSAAGLGADDLLEVAVSYCPELSRNFRVSADGTLALPLLHQPLVVGGLTPSQAAQKLSAALLSEHILTEPVVNVSVIEYRSRPISIVGAVNHPINFQATDRTTLIEALAKAGGLSPTAGSEIIITSEPTADKGPVVRLVAVKDLLGGKSPLVNLALRGGEEIRVPEANKIFVAGNVRRPGAYPMQNDADTTVLKAIALSAGLDSYSSKVAYIYRRREVGPQRNEVRVDLRQIMTRRAPDVALVADDILYVPTAEGKRLTAKILSQLSGFGQTAEAGLLVLR
jgi:polysaccharide export outer membrane protein